MAPIMSMHRPTGCVTRKLRRRPDVVFTSASFGALGVAIALIDEASIASEVEQDPAPRMF